MSWPSRYRHKAMCYSHVCGDAGVISVVGMVAVMVLVLVVVGMHGITMVVVA